MLRIENNGPAIDRSIYVMPMFVNLVVSGLEAAETHYGAAGFVTLALPSRSRWCAFARASAPREVPRHSHGPGRCGTRISICIVHCGGRKPGGGRRPPGGGAEVTGPLDTPWFSTDLTFMDRDGNAITLTTPRTGDQAVDHAWASDHIKGEYDLPAAAEQNGKPD